ncbi:MAG: 3-oxoacyl-[acyl-carrier-protein] reductase [Acidobacteria bacterium]|nr:3-oxoacyl-[acyl-carrier-protein] reductase [Acidobacteriota bacterium]
MTDTQKIALVTGAARGIGREIALELAKKGIDIAVADIHFPDDISTKNDIIALGRKAIEVKVDVSKPESVKEAVEKINEELGMISILINNAGITRDNIMLRMTDEEWYSVININLNGAFNCIKAIVRQMTKNRWGRIVNVTSVVGQRGNAGQANYAASKAGLIGLTKALAIEFASRGVTVNAVAPGFIDTEMTNVLPDKVKEMLLEQVPSKTLGAPADVAKSVAFLVSDDAAYISGHVLAVNGGMYM